MDAREASEAAVVTRCGYRCDLCAAWSPNVTREDRRPALSALWKRCYDLDIAPEAMRCDGCRAESASGDGSAPPRLLDSGCPVRACSVSRGIESCRDCASFPCPTWEERRGLSFEAAREVDPALTRREYDDYLAAFDNGTRFGA